MPVSRSPINFLERNGVIPTLRSQKPRLDPKRLRVHTVPLGTPVPAPYQMLDTPGDPPPDRGKIDPWPPPQEVL